MQACPLLLGLAAQHNKITALPAVLACLLLRMLNLNGNRYSQHLVCNAMHSFLGAHSLQTASRNLSTSIVFTTTCFQMPCINPWYSSLAADWQAGICAVTLFALAYHDQHTVWSYHQYPLSLHELRTINSVAVTGKHLVLAACAHSVMSSHDHACLQSINTTDWLQRCLHDCWGEKLLAC